MRKILYYPNININDGIWLRNALLYWDKVSSIMPHDCSDYDLSPEIQYLMSTEFFEPTRPDKIMFSDVYHDFLDELRGKVSDLNINKRSEIVTRVHTSKLESIARKNCIHHTKLSSDIIPILEEKMQLVRSENSQWYYMDEVLADIYMTTLAKYLAVMDDDDTIISTDRYRFQNIAYTRKPLGSRYNNRRAILNYKIDALPVPLMDVPIDDILEFKVRRQDELKRFRLMVIENEVKIQTCENLVEVKSKLNRFNEELELGISELEYIMKECNWKLRPAVLGALINIPIPSIFEVAETFSYNIPLTYKAMGIATGAVLSCAVAFKELGNIRREALNKSPYAYIYCARRDGIIR